MNRRLLAAPRQRAAAVAAKYFFNPILTPMAGFVPGYALLETKGRKSGQARLTPVSDALRGNTFWIFAEHGTSADYVKNLVANPNVRIRTHGRWRKGVANVLDDDDAIERLKEVRLNFVNSTLLRTISTKLTTIRIDLDE